MRSEIGESMSVLVAGGCEQGLGRTLDQCIDDRPAHGFRPGCDRGAPPVWLLGEQRHPRECRISMPLIVHPEDMGGIGRGHPAQHRATPSHQRAQGPGLDLRFEQPVERGRPCREAIEEASLQAAQALHASTGGPDPQCEPSDALSSQNAGALPLQRVRHELRVLRCE